jgi:hypothetical protein
MSANPQNIAGRLFFNPIKIKAMGKNQHVRPHHDGGLQVKGAGNQKATIITDTQKEAIEIAREIAINQNSEVVIHRHDGTIRDKDSYGNDQLPSGDKKY